MVRYQVDQLTVQLLMLKLDGLKETQDQWLSLVPTSTPKPWGTPGTLSPPLGSSQPCPLPYPSLARGLPSLSFSLTYNPTISAMLSRSTLLSSALFLSHCSPQIPTQPSPFHWPFSIYSLFSLLCLADASGYAILIATIENLISTILWNGHAPTVYRSQSSSCQDRPLPTFISTQKRHMTLS